MTLSSALFFVLVVAVIGVAILALVELGRRRRGNAGISGGTGWWRGRSTLWALLLIVTVPVAILATRIGALVVGLITGRCELYGDCKPIESLSEVEFSQASVIAALVLCVLAFGISLLALMPSPVPRNPRTRRALQLGIAAAFTLFAAYDAFIGL